MVAKAVLRYVRISPRKFRLIIPLVKGKNTEEAISILLSVKKKASGLAMEVLKSAIANAKRKQGVNADNLYISNLVAFGGPMMKRFRAASMGRASMIKKRTSHITIELSERELPKINEAVHDKRSKNKDVKEAKEKATAKPKAQHPVTAEEPKGVKKHKTKETGEGHAGKKGKE